MEQNGENLEVQTTFNTDDVDELVVGGAVENAAASDATEGAE